MDLWTSTGYLLLLAGFFFLSMGVLGLWRFPDTMSRCHGAAKSDTLGAILSVIGSHLAFGGENLPKLLFIVGFLWLTTPTASHLIAQAVLATERKGGDHPWRPYDS